MPGEVSQAYQPPEPFVAAFEEMKRRIAVAELADEVGVTLVEILDECTRQDKEDPKEFKKVLKLAEQGMFGRENMLARAANTLRTIVCINRVQKRNNE